MSSGRVIYMRAAMNKVCPLTQARPFDTAPVGCMGDRCMAWRFMHPQIIRRTFLCDDAVAAVDPGRPASVPAHWTFSAYDPSDGDPACWVQPEEDARLSADGYCAMVPR